MTLRNKSVDASTAPLINGHIRIRKWNEFKNLVIEKKPGSIVYVLEQNGFTQDKEITVLRLIMLCERAYYILIDFPKGDALRETGIPLRKDKKGTRFLEVSRFEFRDPDRSFLILIKSETKIIGKTYNIVSGKCEEFKVMDFDKSKFLNYLESV